MTLLRTGLAGTAELLVEGRHTALEVGSGRQQILATPVLVTLMEAAAQNAIDSLLPEGTQTIGTRLDVRHDSATPVGMRVTATARLIEVHKRTLVFEVSAHDEKELIGAGIHERTLISVVSFSRLLSRKSSNRAVG